jgi:hypothetical protein
MKIKHVFFTTLLVEFVLALIVGGPGNGQAFENAGPQAATWQFDIIGPAGSGAFGRSVVALPNGNVVVTDPEYDLAEAADVGAVYLYNGQTGEQISMLTGQTAGDQVGYPGVTILNNGNYVVRSAYWDNGAVVDAGAVTWGNAETGVSGVLSPANSLVGSTDGDQVGVNYVDYVTDTDGIRTLPNGSYLVFSPFWDNGSAADAGAITWGSGERGVIGMVSSANSLVGSADGDLIGMHNCRTLDNYCAPVVSVLTNSNYVVCSPYWDNRAMSDAGAVTWGNGATGVSGVISSVNSLVGDGNNDALGNSQGDECVTELPNGDYVILSPTWNDYAGAVTQAEGASGITGLISPANSLVGKGSLVMGDSIGQSITVLSNGNYVVLSPFWNRGDISYAGAATWVNAATGLTGEISSTNSLVGSVAGDRVGTSVAALSNGNYVVTSQVWHLVGAVTWGNGRTGISGSVSRLNSMVGANRDDAIGSGGIKELANGNYLVLSPDWDNALRVDAGAVTWGSGTAGIAGKVSRDNSLVGSTSYDRVGGGPWEDAVIVLMNGNYVVGSPYWDKDAIEDVGAATWGNGVTGISGEISPANSLMGKTAGDQIGFMGMTALSNGNYVIQSRNWDNGAAENAGAVTWGSGATGTTGIVSPDNSLVGTEAENEIGNTTLTVLSNGNYVVFSPWWGEGGALTWGSGETGVRGEVSPANSLVGGSDGQWKILAVDALSSGNYLAQSRGGYPGSAAAFTWGYGRTGVTGTISEENSLVSSAQCAQECFWSVTWLMNGNYVIGNEFAEDADFSGAATWGNGTAGISGTASAANSLVGSTPGDGSNMYITALPNGHYVVYNPIYRNGASAAAGAVTWGNGLIGTSGRITGENSVLGTAPEGGREIVWDYCAARHLLVVGRPRDNIITLFRHERHNPTFFPVVARNYPKR